MVYGVLRRKDISQMTIEEGAISEGLSQRQHLLELGVLGRA